MKISILFFTIFFALQAGAQLPFDGTVIERANKRYVYDSVQNTWFEGFNRIVYSKKTEALLRYLYAESAVIVLSKKMSIASDFADKSFTEWETLAVQIKRECPHIYVAVLDSVVTLQPVRTWTYTGATMDSMPSPKTQYPISIGNYNGQKLVCILCHRVIKQVINYTLTTMPTPWHTDTTVFGRPNTYVQGMAFYTIPPDYGFAGMQRTIDSLLKLPIRPEGVFKTTPNDYPPEIGGKKIIPLKNKE